MRNRVKWTAAVLVLLMASSVVAQDMPLYPLPVEDEQEEEKVPPPPPTEDAVVVHPLPVASPHAAPTFVGVYLWQQALWQYTVNAEGETSVERGTPPGGRLVGGIGFGRFGLEGRLDITGLKEQFSLEDPDTYGTIEVYTAAHYVLAAVEGLQIGPLAMAGSVANKQTPKGVSLSTYGFGVRVAGHGGELHLLYAMHDYLPLQGWRFSISLHAPLIPQANVYTVGDLVTGEDGYARVGVAVRLK